MQLAMSHAAPRSLAVSIAVISAAALAYEVLLTRLFAIIQWHHLAAVVISLALLGYGMSGTALALGRETLLRRFRASYVSALAAFGIAAIACFACAQRLAVNPEELLWAPAQMWRPVAMYLCLALPFFCAASAVGLALAARGAHAGRLYAADLIGAGTGAAAITGLLFLFLPGDLLRVVASLGAAAAAAGAVELRAPVAVRLGTMVLIALPWLFPGAWLTLAISPYKALSQQLQVAGSQLVAERASPLGFLSVVANTRVPLRYAPGLSLTASAEPPAQLALFIDADAMTAITRYDGERESLAFLAEMSSALPYAMARPRSVLVPGAGGGLGVLQAMYFLEGSDASIDAVELDPEIVRLVLEDYGAFAGHLYSQRGVRVHVAETRSFLAREPARYDLVQITLPDSFGAASGGLRAATEGYAYTVEALAQYLDHLAAGGYLAITGWVELPPRALPKLFATAVEALERRGVADPSASLALVRGWQTGTLLVKNGELTAEEIAALTAYCRAQGLDAEWYPGFAAGDVERVNHMPRPWLSDTAVALLGPGREQFLRDYKLDLRPATDARPYFQHYFKWRTLPELLDLGRSGFPLLEAGYLLLVAAFVQALLASVLLILAPLLVRRRDWHGSRVPAKRVVLYFLAIGIGFVQLEIAFIHVLTPYLHHPVYAVTVTLVAFLLCAGAGSAASRRAANPRRALLAAVGGVLTLGAGYLLLLPALLSATAGFPLPARFALAIIAIAPLAFCMGLPFPLALAALARAAPALVPWAWGINGCASVVSAVGAALLAVHAGHGSLLLAALAAYALAAVTFPAGDEEQRTSRENS